MQGHQQRAVAQILCVMIPT